jgi:hypothetical protein
MSQSSIRSLAETKKTDLEKIQLLVGSKSLGHYMEKQEVLTTPYLTEKQEKGIIKSFFGVNFKRICYQ